VASQEGQAGGIEQQPALTAGLRAGGTASLGMRELLMLAEGREVGRRQAQASVRDGRGRGGLLGRRARVRRRHRLRPCDRHSRWVGQRTCLRHRALNSSKSRKYRPSLQRPPYDLCTTNETRSHRPVCRALPRRCRTAPVSANRRGREMKRVLVPHLTCSCQAGPDNNPCTMCLTPVKVIISLTPPLDILLF